MRYLLAAALATVTLQAQAHTELAATTPAEDSTVMAPVKEIVLQFEEAVRLTALTLNDAAGHAKAVDAVPTEISARFALAVRDELPAGEYTVMWRAVGDDTHVVSGDFHFTVGMAHSH